MCECNVKQGSGLDEANGRTTTSVDFEYGPIQLPSSASLLWHHLERFRKARRIGYPSYFGSQPVALNYLEMCAHKNIGYVTLRQRNSVPVRGFEIVRFSGLMMCEALGVRNLR